MKNEDTSSSLDLLLDAMSNAFGSIVLICILLIINLNTKTEEIVEKVESDLSAGQIEAYEGTKSAINIENAKLMSEITELSKQNMESLIKEQAELEEVLKKLLEEHSEKLSKAKETLDVNLEIKSIDASASVDSIKNTQNIQSELLAVEIKKSDLLKELINLKASSHRISSSAPLKVSNMTNFIWMIVNEDGFKALDFSNNAEFKDDGTGTLYALIDASNSFDIGAFHSFLNNINPKKEYLAFIVETNSSSYEKLRQFIAISTSKGFSYFWVPKEKYLASFSTKGYTPEGTY